MTWPLQDLSGGTENKENANIIPDQKEVTIIMLSL